MPWSNQNGGGGWKGGNGGPWGQPPRGPSGGGGNQPPDLEELLRRSQEQLRSWLPGGGGSGGSGGGLGGFGAKGIGLGVVAALALWLATGFYRVEPDELGVELVLGKVVAQTTPGLNYNLPYPIGQVFTPKVLAVRELSVGQRDGDFTRGGGRDVPDESLMLTGDENMVDVAFRVQWNVKDATAYLFNIQNPEATVKAVAESAMREVVGKNTIEYILTENQRRLETDVKQLMQKTLDDYGAGIEIRLVNMYKVNPPAQVIDAFRDVQAARIDAERLQNEAQAYANRIVPEARGQAAAVTAQANAYRQRTVEDARGQADRFTKVLEEYRHAPDVTRERLYLETMERVLGGMDKVIVDQGKGEGAIQPYLPLDQLTRKPQGKGATP